MARTMKVSSPPRSSRSERQFPIPPFGTPPPNPPHLALYKDLKSSDITLLCGSHGSYRIGGHPKVLCCASPWFANVLNDPKYNSHHLVLPNSDPAAVEPRLEFCYVGRYASPTDPYYNADVAKANLEFHARVLMVAHKCKATGLAQSALQKIRVLLDGCALKEVTPWINSLKKKGVKCILLQDGAPAHKSRIARDYLTLHHIERLWWPGHSPEVNASEHAWPWIRRHVTKDFMPSCTGNQCEKQWVEGWGRMPIEVINRWVDAY
ncbi:hypothetical protein BU25DRAFT_479034 [Macroventuria anomochaeta]|uniref:Uncharacterized protein n=1 Tax=Macroventuria anomochaeta TaxID=301207 RepID=A0ACB6SB86_9PLEO|nr:uncharacterized protein BU25DRAFT_479034 [Macroventuria anomochaeta]KAF2631471.1 hypothetical protein BU25DRAFT_479034 [Macroventuria anomochaeta]